MEVKRKVTREEFEKMLLMYMEDNNAVDPIALYPIAKITYDIEEEEFLDYLTQLKRQRKATQIISTVILIGWIAIIALVVAMATKQAEPQREQLTQEVVQAMPVELVSISAPIKVTPQPEETPTPPNIEIPLDDELKLHIFEQCGQDEELYCLIMAVIKNESTFDIDAVSADGHDHGLMQLRDVYYGKITDPYENVDVGISLLREFLEYYKHENLALMCYNMGEAGAKRLWSECIYSTEYSDKVLDDYSDYLTELKGE